MAKTQISIRFEDLTLTRIEDLTVAINRKQDPGFGPRTRAEIISMLIDTALPLAEAKWGVAPKDGLNTSSGTALVLPSGT